MTHRPADAALPDEATAFLAAHPDIEAFDLVLTDANGVARGKIAKRRSAGADLAMAAERSA